MTDPVLRPGDASAALADLETLVSSGPRFHGGPGIRAAADWIVAELDAAGLTATRQPVRLSGWLPGDPAELIVTSPVRRDLPAWPMLWSGSSDGRISGHVVELGPQGIWGDSIVWRRYAVIDAAGTPIAYLHGRDGGPAAPQPLPAGSDLSLPHLAIGHWDAMQLSEWIADGYRPTVDLVCGAGATDDAVADNLIVDIAPGLALEGGGTVLLCAHYDTFFNTVGAYDNGSGTIALLHLARRWATTPPPVAVRLVFFTAEEWHLGGSRYYVDQAADLDALDYVLNLDGLGRGSKLEAFASPEPFDAALRAGIDAYAAADRRVLELISRFPPTTGTDDASFYRAGVPSAFLTFNDLHRLHQPDDTPNPGIAANIAWTIGLAEHLVATLGRPPRAAAPGIL